METVIPSVIEEKEKCWGKGGVEYRSQSLEDLVLWSIRLNGIQCLTSTIISQINGLADGMKLESKALRGMSAAQAKEEAEKQKQAADKEREKVLMTIIEKRPELGPYDPSLNQCSH